MTQLLGVLGLASGIFIAGVAAVVTFPCLPEIVAGVVAMAGVDVISTAAVIGVMEGITTMTTAVTTQLCLTTAALWSAAGIGFGGGAAAVLLGCTVDKRTKVLAKEVKEEAERFRDQLKKMLVFGEKINVKLNDFNDSKHEQMAEHLKQLKSAPGRKKVKSAAISIIQYLKQYQQQGNKIVDQVEKSQKTIIDAWEAS